MSHQSDLIATDIDAYLAEHERKELLRFITCGSVDDGKSTLIGTLLIQAKAAYEDQLAAVARDSVTQGSTGGDFDPALLTDGLKAEREQGITIDVAYRYFSTSRRKYIIADTPGHEQYTRNMATGASTADLAIILIDARLGVLTQTKRHSFIVSLLGIKHALVTINKMDLVDYRQEVFEQIKEDYTAFAARLEMPDLHFIPISALKGDNVVESGENMPWYGGSTLMHMLETVHIASDRNLNDFRFPVQYVNRPHLDFRGFCGTIASGIVRKGEEVMVLPSRKTSRVKSIVTFDGDLEEAFAPQAITLVLDDEIDVSRGDMICRPGNLPSLQSKFDAMVVWMAEEPMVPGKPYIFKQATKTVPGAVNTLRYQIDVNTLHRLDAPTLGLNEIGRCEIDLNQPIAFDGYRRNRATGSFIIIDRLTEYFTSWHFAPVQEIARSTQTGSATTILAGLAEGYESSVWAVLLIAASILASIVIYGGVGVTPTEQFTFVLYGVAMTGIGMLTLTGNNVAMDAFGPIADNAQGISELAGEAENAGNRLERLDAAGNTTKAITKGLAIGSAVIAAVSLFGSFLTDTQVVQEALNVPKEEWLSTIGINLANPLVFIGLLIGGALPLLFASLMIKAVSRAAFEMINEVRRQLRIPGIMEGTKTPDYAVAIGISTRAAQRELLPLGLIAVLTPIVVGFLLGAQALGGFLGGIILSGQLLAVFMSN
ncbi:MAG: sulfate adenylyltransferase subunit CysN, partial [Planctomycetes bacterium]|nr:sulfate adenylyltransferase subunit CysN [Planctomycetota bacterium]